jgi:hypothetical protein
VTFPYDEWEREEALWHCLRQQNRERIPDKQRSEETDDKTDIALACRDEADLPPTPANHSEPNPERDYRLEIKKYRVEIITLVVLVIYTIINYWLYRSTHEQLYLSQRPWIAMEVSLASPLTFTDKAGSMFVNVHLKNIGNSVALNVHPFCKLGARRYATDDALSIAFENKACDGLSEQTEHNPHAGMMLFPSEPLEHGEGVAVSQKDIADAVEANSKSMKFDMGGLFDPLLICCVDYRSVLDKASPDSEGLYDDNSTAYARLSRYCLH